MSKLFFFWNHCLFFLFLFSRFDKTAKQKNEKKKMLFFFEKMYSWGIVSSVFSTNCKLKTKKSKLEQIYVLNKVKYAKGFLVSRFWFSQKQKLAIKTNTLPHTLLSFLFCFVFEFSFLGRREREEGLFSDPFKFRVSVFLFFC